MGARVGVAAKIIALKSLSPLLLHPTQTIMNGNRTTRREKVNKPLSCLEESHLVTSNDQGKFILKQCTQSFHPAAERLEHGPRLGWLGTELSITEYMFHWKGPCHLREGV